MSRVLLIVLTLAQTWAFTDRVPGVALQTLTMAAYRSTLKDNIQTCLSIMRCCQPFVLSIDPGTGAVPPNASQCKLGLAKYPDSAALQGRHKLHPSC